MESVDMRFLGPHIRNLALVQLLLALPLMGSNTVCIPLDRVGRAEPGYCVCTIARVSAEELSIGSAGADECGPCHDVALSAVRIAGCAAPMAPAMTSTQAMFFLPTPAPAMPIVLRVWFGESTGARLPILRC
jgi:hypothetical protein